MQLNYLTKYLKLSYNDKIPYINNIFTPKLFNYINNPNNIYSKNNLDKVKIYILAYNETTLKLAKIIFNKYYWAEPILLKYQDYRQENTFWQELYENQEKWINYDMIGTLSYSSFKKINIQEVHNIIDQKLYYPYKYYHFMDSNINIPNGNTNKHPHFLTIWNRILHKLNLKTTTENNCNYWMCSTHMMLKFITWYNKIAHPTLINEDLIFEDSKYNGDYNETLNKERLIKLWNKPYYSYYPFIAERLNKCFFETFYSTEVIKVININTDLYKEKFPKTKQQTNTEIINHFYKYGGYKYINLDITIKRNFVHYNNFLPKTIFLIHHNREIGGAQSCLKNLENIYNKKNYNIEILYANEIIDIDFIELIINKANKYNSSPIVICNTLITYNIIEKLSKTNILTYWYIHEWLDDKYFKEDINFKDCLNNNVNLIFVSILSYFNMTKYITFNNKYHIITNTLDIEVLKNKLQEKILYYKDNSYIYIGIIGTIEQRKNQAEFIKNVFIPLNNKLKNIKLLLVGKDTVNLYNKFKNIKNIDFVGCVNNAIPYINMCDIIVSYSINEVLPLNIIESFYCKKPVIASSVGAVADLIQNEYNGYLFEVNDHNKCYNLLINIITNNSLRKTIGNNAYNVFINKHSNSVIEKKLEKLLMYKM